MVVQELIAKLGFQIDQGSAGKADQSIEAFGKKALKMVGAFWLAQKAMSALSAGISEAITGAMDVEDLETQYRVMLGNANAAKYMMQEIRDYANVTAYTTTGVAKSMSLLLAAMSGEEAIHGMKLLGDIALGNQEKMQGLALAMMQVKQKGRIQGDELIQFAERGFDPLQYIAARRKMSTEDLRDAMQKKKLTLTYQDLVWAMEQATAKGGKFYKGAEEGGKTLRGRLSTLKDSFLNLGITLVEKVEPFLKNLIDRFMELFPLVEGSFLAMGEFFQIMFEGQEATDWAIGFAAALGTIADAIMVVGILFQQLKMDWYLLMVPIYGAVGAIVDVFKLLTSELMGATKLVATVGYGINKLFQGIGKMTGNKEMEASARAGAAESAKKMGGDVFGTSRAWMGDAASGLSRSGDQMVRMWDKIGTMGTPKARIKKTDEVMEAFRKGQTKPLIQTTNNINNNVTVHGDDPLKMASESLFGQAFQKQFLMIQAATV